MVLYLFSDVAFYSQRAGEGVVVVRDKKLYFAVFV